MRFSEAKAKPKSQSQSQNITKCSTPSRQNHARLERELPRIFIRCEVHAQPAGGAAVGSCRPSAVLVSIRVGDKNKKGRRNQGDTDSQNPHPTSKLFFQQNRRPLPPFKRGNSHSWKVFLTPSTGSSGPSACCCTTENAFLGTHSFLTPLACG